MDVAAGWIETILARPLFRQVQPEPALQSLEDEPLDGALHRVAHRLLDPGLAYSPGGDLQSALKHTYDLFELFVLYRLIDELPKQLGSGWTLKGGKPLKWSRANCPMSDDLTSEGSPLFKPTIQKKLNLHYSLRAVTAGTDAPPQRLGWSPCGETAN